jgi:hypothetical protein
MYLWWVSHIVLHSAKEKLNESSKLFEDLLPHKFQGRGGPTLSGASARSTSKFSSTILVFLMVGN